MKRWIHFWRLACALLTIKKTLSLSALNLIWGAVTATVIILLQTGHSAPVRAIDPAFAETQWHQASFPVENFQAYTSPFGYRADPYGGGQRFHYGLDMAAPAGSYIRSWWGGQVIEVSDDSSCGTSVVVQSGNWMHIYCHMQGHVVREGGNRYMVDPGGGLRIREGQTVDTGTRIGRIGMTGRTTGPHLHWGLKYAENWVDPALVLRAMYSSQQAMTSH
ncbi:MAG: M23 family metallopeptidase [Cyanobacteria bacterium P01_D01_bin.71]